MAKLHPLWIMDSAKRVGSRGCMPQTVRGFRWRPCVAIFGTASAVWGQWQICAIIRQRVGDLHFVRLRVLTCRRRFSGHRNPAALCSVSCALCPVFLWAFSVHVRPACCLLLLELPAHRLTLHQ